MVCCLCSIFVGSTYLIASIQEDSSKAKLADAVVQSSDGVRIAYTVGGKGERALLFIHGGMADRSFWSGQLGALASRYQVIAVDLGGHGASGRNRERWTLQSLGEDVRAVVNAIGLRRVVLVGNSMGGPVALEAAKLLPGRVVAVVAVDTFQDLSARPDPAIFRARAQAFRNDFTKNCSAMARQLFHPDADKRLVEDVQRRFANASPEVITALMESFATYDTARAAIDAHVPVRCLNGDLFPTKVESNRKAVPDFEAIIFRHTGHFPMLERPQEFNQRLEEIVQRLVK